MSSSSTQAALGRGRRLASLAELKDQAIGKWPYIFEDLAPELSEAMGAKGRHVPCPVHGGKDGFRLFPEYPAKGNGICNTCGAQTNGFAMLAWVKGYDFKDAVREVGQWLRGESGMPAVVKRPPVKVTPTADRSKALKTIRQIWTETLPIKGSVAERYLSKRGIWSKNVPQTLRFHPGLANWDPQAKKVLGRFPAMVAPVKNSRGQIVALHRTYLTDDGCKAPVPEPRKMTMLAAPVQGAAIKLFSSTHVLDVGEGIETLLAVHVVTRGPVWSAVSATLLECLEVPHTVKLVRIWADKDSIDEARKARALKEGRALTEIKGRGEEAAEKLAQRLREQGKTVEIMLPSQPIPEGAKGIDWLDVLQRYGTAGFSPRRREIKSPA